MAEVPFRPARQLSEYKGKGASASRECNATNKFGSATCKITLSECAQCLTATEKTVGGEGKCF